MNRVVLELVGVLTSSQNANENEGSTGTRPVHSQGALTRFVHRYTSRVRLRPGHTALPGYQELFKEFLPPLLNKGSSQNLEKKGFCRQPAKNSARDLKQEDLRSLCLSLC